MMAGLTQSRLKELLHYSPLTGDFTWKVANSNRVKVGDVAGAINSQGRRQIKIDGKRYQAHRLAFLCMTGSWPKNMIDHVNGKPDVNRWKNLREATNMQNQQNSKKRKDNTSGFKGVTFRKDTGKYRAYATDDGKRISLGCFASAEDAHKAYCSAAKAMFGEFANTGAHL